ncbi:hypothetical protein Dsin_001230 [Dipteronia sinensis]|uniref:KOW domain-containing protein n=1 Tax=Dipteronia sinensis TaxID=43782 RepID=A0AAE0B4Z6_9ROSI|nr:hypothetical protein Dsin_001230 [Dipteronia sinensis]
MISTKIVVDNVVMIIGGKNRDHVGTINNRGGYKDRFETIHVQDATGHEVATRLNNVYTISKGKKP